MRYLQSFALIFILSAGVWFYLHNFPSPYQQFSQQATSFLNGHLDIPQQSHDTVVLNGKEYWPQGPFPSVLLMPFQAILGEQFNQSFVQPILLLAIAFLLYKLCRHKKFNRESSIYLALAFFFATPFIGLAVDSKSWFFAQIVADLFLVATIYELETKQRFWLLGIFTSALFATRPTSAFIIIVILYVLFKKIHSIKHGIFSLFLLVFPLVICLGALFYFNFVRFGDPLDNGYLTNNVGGYIGPLRDIGLFSIQHIPSNIYYYFLISVEPVKSNSAHLIFPFYTYSVWGLSFFLISPFFVYAFNSLKNKHLYLRSLWITLFLTLFALLCYYAPGWYQFGPRYSADLIPVLFLLTLYGLKIPHLTNFQKNLIIISSLINLYLLFSPNWIK